MRKSTTDEIIGSYQDRFTGLGKLKDFKLELHVDESIKPVTQTARKIPLKMKKQFEHKLKELEDSDVIEKVQGATPLGLTPSRGSESEFRHPYLCRYEMR